MQMPKEILIHGQNFLNKMKEELNRKYRVINMMVSMHSVLHQRYKTKSLFGSIFFLLAAIILNIFTFFDYSYIEFLGVNEGNAKNILAFVSFLIFLLSVIFLLVEWSKKGEQHLQAINQLSRLLNELRAIQSIEEDEIVKHKIELFDELYNQTFDTVPKIPDNKFNTLKAKHYKKVAVSKFIDTHKGKPYLVIRILFFLNIFASNEK